MPFFAPGLPDKFWIAGAHRDNGKRYVVRADEKVTAFLELQSAIRPTSAELHFVTKPALARWERLKANGNGAMQPERFCECGALVVNGERVPCLVTPRLRLCETY